MDEIRRILVLFGSQTGTAEDISEELGNLLRNRHFMVQVSPMDNYPIQNLITERVVLFVSATTGKGEEPDNMKLSWRFLLRRELPNNSLQHTFFAVLGLGDSSYQKFNFVAKRLDKRLTQLGGIAILPLALADDQHELGIDAIVYPWITEICLKLMSLFPLRIGLEIIPDFALPPPKYNIIEKASLSLAKTLQLNTTNYSEYSPFLSKLKSNTRVTHKDHFQDTRLISIDIIGSAIQYSAGDVAMIQPRNSNEVINEFISLLSLDPKTIILITPNEEFRQLPSNLSNVMTLFDFVSNIDLNSRPRRSFFSLLSKLSKDELERERLVEFSSTEGQDDLFDYCYRPRKTLLEVLQDFPKTSSQIPFTYILDLIPAIKPRAFSIASSPKTHINEIHLLIARVEYKTKLFKPRLGLCSNWLANLNIGDLIPIWIKQGTFKLSKFETVPYIMIGPGTGVAPFRSIIYERCFNGIKENYLFFGCRSFSRDFYFESEWNQLATANSLILFTAFSRDYPKNAYVQHTITEKKQLVTKLFTENCMVLIAGKAKDMPNNVLEALRDIIKEAKSISESEAEDFIQLLIKQGKIQLETWS